MSTPLSLGALRRPPGPWVLEAFRIADGATGPTALVRQLRARILYDRGRRPAFRHAEGHHVDDQDLDHGAWHFIARREPGGPPLGYVRLSTPSATARFQSRAYLGSEAYDRLLDEHGLTPDGVFEHSRLVVEHHARKLGLGVHLNALAIGAAHALGATAMTGTSGTRDGQHQFHERFGFRVLPGTRRYVEHYTEDVVLMLRRAGEESGEHADLVARFAEEFPGLAAAGATASTATGGTCLTATGATTSTESGAAPRATGTGATAPHATTAAASRAPAPRDLTAARRNHAPDLDSWQPRLYAPSRPEDRKALEALIASDAVRELHDTIGAQIDELITSREPGVRPDEARRRDQLAGLDAWSYGSWAHYPWSGRLVHVLPREEFRLVRTDRNRGRIERPEQRRLLDSRVGVIGLSVGNSAAVTLALEGVAGRFRLADFDTLGMSNLNRLRAGMHELGLNKAVLTARQLYEIDPYLEIEIFPAGLDGDNLDAFLAGLDLVVEECDTPYIKVAARERARAAGIPVVMDCNDRGMLDVERFDLEPDRPLLHGRIAVDSGRVAGLSRPEQIELLLAMVDADRISPQLRASFAELGRSLSSWPQLASGVSLGGALVTEAARRILLGGDCPSGRYYVDLTDLIAAHHDVYRSQT
ncbi:ThiF family adenylyltransferase [Longispora urticae]